MNYFMKKEVEGLKGDIKASEIQLEVEKYSFERKLNNGFGEEMLSELNKPTKPNWLLGLKIKYNRWKQARKEMKEYRKIMKDLEKN